MLMAAAPMTVVEKPFFLKKAATLTDAKDGPNSSCIWD